MSSLGGET